MRRLDCSVNLVVKALKRGGLAAPVASPWNRRSCLVISTDLGQIKMILFVTILTMAVKDPEGVYCHYEMCSVLES